MALTPKLQEAFNVLDQATQPQQVGRIARAGYVQIDAALAVIFEAIKPMIDAEQAPAVKQE